MNKSYKLILAISIIITGLLFWHDYVYDKPAVPYTLAQTLQEIAIIGSLYVAVLFAIIAGVYYGFTKLKKQVQ